MEEESRVLRPLSVLDLFDETFSLYRSNFLLMAGVTGLVYIPLEIFRQTQPLHQLKIGQVTVSWSGLLILTLIMLAAGLIVEAALTKVITERYLGHESSITGAYGFILQRFYPFLGTLILMGLAILVGLITLVGWIIVFFWLSFVLPVFVVEDRTYADAMGRSRELAKQNWGRIFLVGLITWLLSIIVGLGIGALVPWLLGTSPTGIKAVLAGTLQGIIEALVLPIGLIPFVLLYFDLRVRKEGYDLELLAQEMAARAGGLSEQ